MGRARFINATMAYAGDQKAIKRRPFFGLHGRSRVGTGDPSATATTQTPDFQGQYFLDTSNDEIWISYGVGALEWTNISTE